MATSQLRPQAALPSLIVRDMAGRKQRSKTQYDKRASTTQREFSPGERVFVKPNPQNKHKPWIYGEVVGNPAPRASLVSNPLGPIRRNHSQIRKARTEPTHQYPAEPVDLETISLPGKGDMPADKNQQTDQAVEEQNPQVDEADQGVLESEPTQPSFTLRRSSRNRNMPSTFKDYAMNIVHYLRNI